MNRMLRNSLAFLFGFFIAAFFVLAHAETCANGQCTQPAENGPRWYEQNGAYGTSYSSAQLACDAIAQRRYDQNWSNSGRPLVLPTPYTLGAGGTSAYCVSQVMEPGPYYSSNGSFTVYMFSQLTCPSGQNWTLTGQTCTRPACVAPQTRQADGTCSAPQCTHAANAQVGGMYVIPRPVPSGVI